MRLRTPFGHVLAALALLLSLLGVGCNQIAAPLAVKDPWVRPANSGSMSASYLTVVNNTSKDMTLTGITCDAATDVSMHQTTISQDDGMTRMESVTTIVIPAHGRIVFEPIGFHVMMQLQRKLVPGDKVTLTLHFASGERFKVIAPVRESAQ